MTTSTRCSSTHIADEFKKRKQGIDLRLDQMALQRLKEAAEKAKLRTVEFALDRDQPAVHHHGPGGSEAPEQMTLSRAKFEQIIEPIIDRTRGPATKALADAGLSAGELDEVILVGGSTRIPLVQATVKEIFGKEPGKGVNPDEAVGVGAAIQGAVLSGDEQVKDILLLDVTPLTLGIETEGNVMTHAHRSQHHDSHQEVPGLLDRGRQPAAGRNPRPAGRAAHGGRTTVRSASSTSRGFPPAPRGLPQIEVTFDIDANGILHVTATDKGTGKEQKITIEASSGLSDEDIAKMKVEAEENADQDKEFKELAEAKNRGEQMIYTVKKTLDEHGDKASDDERKEIEANIEALETQIKTDDTAAITAAMEELMKASHKLAEKVYAQAAEQPQAAEGQPEPQAAPAEENVVDADFEVKD